MPRKLKSQDGNPYDTIRGMWEGAYVSHFVRLFQRQFGFSSLTTQDLEEALVEEDSITLADIFARLLRFLTSNEDILISNFDTYLRNLLIKERAEVPRFLENGTTWQDLAPEEKLGTLKWLIDHVSQEKEEDFADFADENYTADDLRGIRAGQDAFNNVYWYLDDLRLYRELPHRRQNKKDWECVCSTLTDWQSFIKQFRKTSNLREKELYTYLNFELYPVVEVQLLHKKDPQSKEEFQKSLLEREQKDLYDMLDKKTFLDCNVSIKSDVSCASPICIEKQNGDLSPLKISDIDESSITDILEKSLDSVKSITMNDCDGHLNIEESVPITSNLKNKSNSTTNSLNRPDVKTEFSTVLSNDLNASAKSFSSSTMDIQPNTESNMCAISCTSSCASTCGNIPITSAEVNKANPACLQGSNCTTSSTNAPTASLPLSQENSQEVNLQQSLSDIPSDSSSIAGNKENQQQSSITNDLPPMSAMSNMLGATPPPATTSSVQPLPSNMVNKTSFQLETQYMQQQSQIFVFSTALANKAAESYLSGQYPSIIAFHCATPGTKQFLEKYPLKIQQFNRQNPAAWLNSMAQMKQTGRQMKPMTQFPGPHCMNNRFPGPSPSPGMSPCSGNCNMHNPGMCSGNRAPTPWPANCGTNVGSPMPGDMCMQSWPCQQYQPGATSTPNHRFPHPQGMGARPLGPSDNPMFSCMNPSSGGAFPNSSPNSMPMNQAPGGPSSLTGVKVPDENLTPQQRQHREEQLAMIRKMQQMLFPEQQQLEQSQCGMNPNMGPGMNNQVPTPHSTDTRFGPTEMCPHPGMNSCFSPHQSCMSDHDHSLHSEMYMGNSMMGPNFPQQNFPAGSASAQMEWQKLQHQFYEERRKKQGCLNMPLSHASSESDSHQTPGTPGQPVQTQQQPTSQPPTPLQQNINSPSPGVGLSPGARIQGPPPPYHQTNRRTMPSPHPTSPNTSSLSMPSPHMTSSLPSPAESSRQFPLPTPPGTRLPHPSPGPTTPAGSSSLHTTPLNSPKPLSTSGPGSNNANLTRTPTTPSNSVSTPASTPTSSCAPIICNSGPNTPASSCSTNRKQSQNCNVDMQDSNSVSSTTTINPEFGSCPVPASNSSGDFFCSNIHSCNQTSKLESCAGHNNVCSKEPSLMPVPSPQQIQYLNAFDGQELTIQKQPNTSIKDIDTMSPASISAPMTMSAGSHSHYQSPEGPSFPNTPGSCPSALESSQDSMTGRYPVSAASTLDGSMQRFPTPNPHMANFDSTGPRPMLSMQSNDNSIPRFPGASTLDMNRLPVPHSINHNLMEEANGRFPGPYRPGYCGPTNSMNMPRFPMGASEGMHRMRGPSPHTNMDIVNSRFMGSNPHMHCVENMPQSSQMNHMGPDKRSCLPSQPFRNSSPALASQNSPCMGNNFIADSNMPHSHLQNLQKMTPPFESTSGNKISPEVISPLTPCSNSSANSNMNVPSFDGNNSVASTTQSGASQRLTHFDPIASMAAMSESTVPSVSATGTTPTPQNMISPNIISENSTNNQSNMVNFNSNVQLNQSAATCSMPNQRPQFNSHNQMPHGPCTPHTNNTFANSTMSMQPMNMQNSITTTPYSMNSHDPNMNHHSMHPGFQGNGANTISCSVTSNHPIMHTNVATISNSNMIPPGPRLGAQGFPGQPNIQRAMSPGGAGSPGMMPRGAPFNPPNVPLKAGAPNTIQYLPARQQSAASVPGHGSTLDFLQRFAAPLTNLDNKVPTHNLQYFPNSGGSHNPMVHGGMGMNSNPVNIAPNMMNSQRPVNMMMGPMMRGASPNVHPAGQLYPGSMGGGIPNVESPMYGRPPCPPVNNQMMPMNVMSGGQNANMFPNKQMLLPMGGMAPDTTQPLPPSMGQSFNYKQSPFYGPTTADPNYAVQFHNFQQQLYATNTRGSQMNSQNMAGQGFFGNK